jgi:phage tail sheath protein FI
MSTYLHPGVYIEEFAPGAPIEGVGTSTAAFIGVAPKGPTEATRLTSWDAFQATYGGPLDELYAGGARAWLAGSVKGFFENGGTACWIVRASSGTFAAANLLARNAPNDPVVVAKAIVEGAAGSGLQLTVADRNGVNVALGANLKVHRTPALVNVTGWQAANPRTLKVASNAAFQQGDFVTLTRATKPTITVPIASVSGTDTVVFSMPLGDDYTGGKIRTADLPPGTKTLRVDVPAGKQLRRILFAGSTVVVDATGTAEYRVVERVGADSITLRNGLANAHALTADVQIASAEFDLQVVDTYTGHSEQFNGLGMDSAHPSWFGSVVSTLVTIAPPAAPPSGVVTDPRPGVGTTNVTPGVDDDRASAWSALESDPSTQLAALEPIDEVAITAIPGAVKQTSQLALVGHCERMGDRVAVIDPPFGQSPTQVAGLAPALSGTDRGFGALYYPWITVVDAASKKITSWPPSAHVAGVYARTDAERGVFKAPANTTVRGALGVERKLTDADQDLLNPAGVNAFRLPPAGGPPRIFGARTTSTTTNKVWMYINIRRLFNWLEESIAEGIAWAVFEPNDQRLWKKLDRTITAFLAQAQRDGAIFGTKPAQGFYVRIDEALNPSSERMAGKLHMEIGVMPVYPAEFVIVRIGIWDGGSDVAEA